MKFKLSTFNLSTYLPILVTSIFLFFSHHPLMAQLSQPVRYEKEHKGEDRDFTLIPMGEKGIALIRDKQKYEKGNTLWELIILDTALQEVWLKDLAIESRYVLVGHEYRDQLLYFLFRLGDTDQGKLKIIKVDFIAQHTEEHRYEPELTIKLTHFNVVENQAILAGEVSGEPTILLYNLKNDQVKIIPGLLLSNSELLEVRVNVNNTFNALFKEKKSKTSKRLIAKTFDHTGVQLLDDVDVALTPEGRRILPGDFSRKSHAWLALALHAVVFGHQHLGWRGAADNRR